MMSTEKLFEIFKKNNSKNRDSKTASSSFIREYGDVSFEEAFVVYLDFVSIFKTRKEKINIFENSLISSNARVEYSDISESRYYYQNGCKYRFSGHIYPTGSMTNKSDNIFDFAANPELIDSINFQ